MQTVSFTAAPVAAPAARSVTVRAAKGWLGQDTGVTGLDRWYGADRKLFLPSGLLDRNDVPAYLTGELAGDYGYDPLGLGQDVAQVDAYRVNELLHARWAMLAAFGIIVPEALQQNGADIKGGVWYETGAVLLDGNLNYFAVPFASISNPLPLVVAVGIEVALMGLAEKYRASGEGPAKGYAPGVGNFDDSIWGGLDGLYPGGPFDPLGLADDPEAFAELKVKEIKNGRLAMVSVLGFGIQALVTGEGPYANWSKHVADPFGYNLVTIIGNEERVPTL
jgi:light-harvesting complex II chlorophyll a/b binding protein 5